MSFRGFGGAGSDESSSSESVAWESCVEIDRAAIVGRMTLFVNRIGLLAEERARLAMEQFILSAKLVSSVNR